MTRYGTNVCDCSQEALSDRLGITLTANRTGWFVWPLQTVLSRLARLGALRVRAPLETADCGMWSDLPSHDALELYVASLWERMRGSMKAVSKSKTTMAINGYYLPGWCFPCWSHSPSVFGKQAGPHSSGIRLNCVILGFAVAGCGRLSTCRPSIAIGTELHMPASAFSRINILDFVKCNATSNATTSPHTGTCF